MSNHWTSNYWFLLHSLGYTYREKHADRYIKVIKLSKHILPCPKCRAHFISYYANNKLNNKTINRNLLISWIINYHNDVNVTNNAQTFSEEAVYNFYHNNNILTVNNEKICDLIKQLDKHIKENDREDYKYFIKFLSILRKIYPYENVRKKLKKIKDNNLSAKSVCRIITKYANVYN
jgi:hypothetical protein